MTEHAPLKWYPNSKEKIPEIQEHLSEIRDSGISDIQKGLRKVEYVESVESDLRYTSAFLSTSSVELYSGDEQISMFGEMLGGTITNLADETARVNRMCSIERKNGEFDLNSLTSLHASTDITSASTVILTHSIEERIRSLDTTYIPVSSASPPERLYDHEGILNKLKEKLSKLGKTYLLILESSEKSLLRGGSGDLIQAAHSMRECFEKTVNELAPEKLVKIQPWFLAEYPESRGVPRIAKLMFIVRNSKKQFLQDDLKSLEYQMNNAKCVMDVCLKIAHGHLPEGGPDMLRTNIDLLRFYLLTILDISLVD